jgi:O-antigen ligase
LVNLFGETLPIEVLFAFVAALTCCLLIFRFSTVLFLTLLCLTLPSIQIPELARFGRWFRWAFLAALAVKGLSGGVSRGVVPRPVTLPNVLILLIAVHALASTAYSFGPELTAAHAGALCLLWFGVFVVVWNYWGSGERIRELCTALYRLAVLLFLGSLVWILAGQDDPSSVGRYSGIFTNPNGAGQAVAAFAPFVYLRYRDTRRETGVTSPFHVLLALTMLLVLVRSGSRSGTLATVLCIGLVLALTYRVRLIALAPVLLGLLALAAWFGTQADEDTFEHSSLIRTESLGTVGERLPVWEKGFGHFLEKPFLGHGFGMSRFADIGRADFDLARVTFRVRGENYHNAHLQLAIDLGALGLALFWLFLFSVFRRGVRLQSLPAGHPLADLGTVFIATFVALGADTLVHGWAFSPGSSASIMFWIVAAAVARVDALTREQAPEEEQGDLLGDKQGLPGASEAGVGPTDLVPARAGRGAG